MLFGKQSIGVEINPSGVAFAALSGNVATPQLDRVARVPFPAGTLRISLREPNIQNPQSFVETLKSGHNLLLKNIMRLNVSLPDTVGRIMMIDMEGRFKSRSEALDMIKWKLKKNLPFDVSDTHLDYQQVTTRENGDMVLLVALVSKAVIAQYEEFILSAGFTPALIDFNSFNLQRVFDARLDQRDEVTIIAFYDSILSIMVFSNGLLEFQRIKDLTGSLGVDSRVYTEINSSLIVYRDRFPERQLQTITCIAPPEIAHSFCNMVEEAVGMEPLMLEVKSSVIPSDGAPADQATIFPYTAAIGAAMRSL